MAAVNRYTQSAAPLTINPLSVEQLSLVPLAKAQAEAQGIKTINSYLTDYDVDMKDLPTISKMTGEIDKRKESLVSDIANNGINSSTVNEVLKLKKDRNKLYKDYINKAQENKKRIETWSSNVDKMALTGRISPKYAELIKKKVYGNWQGTIGEKGEVNEFQEDYGPRYFDVQQDIQQIMSRAGLTESSKYGEGEYKKDEKTGAIVYVTPGGKKIATNKRQLEAAAKNIKDMYFGKDQERTEFAKFTDMKEEDLVDLLNQYKKQYRRSSYAETPGRVQVVSKGGTGQPQSGYMPNYTKGRGRNINLNRGSDAKIILEGIGEGVKGLFQKPVPTMDVYDTRKPPKTTVEKAIDFYNNIKQRLSDEDKLEMKEIQSLPGYDQVKKLAGVKSNMTPIEEREAVLDYLEKINNQLVSPIVNQEGFEWTDEGQLYKGMNKTKWLTDMFTNVGPDVRVYDYETGKILEGDDLDKLRKNKDKLNIKGSVPINSPYLLDEEGNYINNMATGTIVVDMETGKEYGFTPKLSERQSLDYQLQEEIGKNLTTLPFGKTSDNFVVKTPEGYVDAKIARNMTTGRWDDYVAVLPDGSTYNFNINQVRDPNDPSNPFIKPKSHVQQQSSEYVE